MKTTAIKPDNPFCQLNPDAPIPLYRQLADLLMNHIRSGEYPAGSRIPSENQMAAAHKLGRPTVRQAIELLVRKGVLVRRRGSGTYVREPQQKVDLFSLDGTSASFRKKGLTVETCLLTPVVLKPIQGSGENPFSGRTAYYLCRLTRVGDAPILLERIYLHPQLFAGIERIDLRGQSLSAIADERFFLRPSSGRQSFRIGYAEDEDARILDVKPQTPLLLVSRQLDFSQSPCGVFSELWCRTERFVFSQTIGGTGDG
jgi:GntR family transcriptional regulator